MFHSFSANTIFNELPKEHQTVFLNVLMKLPLLEDEYDNLTYDFYDLYMEGKEKSPYIIGCEFVSEMIGKKYISEYERRLLYKMLLEEHNEK